MRLAGGSTYARSTTAGRPFSSRNETSASPTPSSVIASSVLELGVGAHRLRRRFHRLLVARRERAQRVLHAVAELAQHRVRHVERILRDEKHADALGADEPHDLLDLVEQRLRRVGEQQVRFVEEEHELRLVAVADFGQALVQLGQQPQQQRRVHLRRLHQPVGGEDVDHALAVDGLQEVVDVEHRLAEELVGALLLEREQAALDGADRRRRDVAVVGLEILRVVADVLQQRAQVLEVEQQQSAVVGDLERQGEHAFLGVVEIEDARRAAAVPCRRPSPAPDGPARRTDPRK